MTHDVSGFAVNLYSYLFSHTAADAVRHLSDRGFTTFELMMFPGHLWYGADGAALRRDLAKAQAETGASFLTVNMPNIDVNIAACDPDMRDYSLTLLENFLRVAGELAVPRMVLGPGKPNPLFPAPKEFLMECFFAGLNRLLPVADRAGVTLCVENMPFAFLPGAEALAEALDDYGSDSIGIVYDVANAHFIGEDIAAGLARVQRRLRIVHLSDTTQSTYKHDAVGLGDVPFNTVMPNLTRTGSGGELPVLEIISSDPDAAIETSARTLAAHRH